MNKYLLIVKYNEYEISKVFDSESLEDKGFRENVYQWIDGMLEGCVSDTILSTERKWITEEISLNVYKIAEGPIKDDSLILEAYDYINDVDSELHKSIEEKIKREEEEEKYHQLKERFEAIGKPLR